MGREKKDYKNNDNADGQQGKNAIFRSVRTSGNGGVS